MRRLRTVLLIFALVVPMGCTVSLAIYSYRGQGDGYQFVNGTPPNCDPILSCYYKGSSIIGSIVFEARLAPDLMLADVGAQVMVYEFNDGSRVLDDTNSTFSIIVSTDANGDIVEWDMTAFVVVGNQIRTSFLVGPGAFDQVAQPGVDESFGAISIAQGSWVQGAF